MKRAFSTLLGSSLLATTVALASSLTPANAASMNFDINDSWGAPLKIDYTLDDLNGSGKIQFTVKVDSTSPNIADLRGVFFNISNDSLLSDLKVTGTDVTTSVFGPAGSVESVGSANLKGDGNTHKFDIGVEIGENGLKGGKDDFQTTTFTLASKSGQALSLDMFLNQEFGIRATSVGTGNNRELSSKVAGYSPVSINYSNNPPTGGGGGNPSTGGGGGNPSTGGGGGNPSTGGGGGNGGPRQVPEPASMAGLSLVAASLLVSRRQKASKTA